MSFFLSPRMYEFMESRTLGETHRNIESVTTSTTEERNLSLNSNSRTYKTNKKPLVYDFLLR